ncbi:uncharacterized protein C7orf57 homolog [Etheostoma spectabile]|uniref:uncharacterized protein C7orf57 homolog n=1 Tax=Etheostoma spectabile TaxID=54343 RepID=UPI0013AFB3DF|nr:uncharacterized protein C7orf57 homolog [Etheostoma spectabile]XP_032362481.1 uncharacterized protein C7orf57 homolog [Etheostoma spectabile]XP_032362482.1 uncharacterized protein C7orf57 homolog [Etheostoma spectabile]
MSSAEMNAAVPNHRRTKPGGIKTGVVASGMTGPTSQIPGLSQTADETSPVERTTGRRVGIFESDSEYVKLAKGGGHKGLLSHDADADDKPMKPYNPPNWFSDELKSGSKPTFPDSKMTRGMQPLAAPFGTDNGSSWERDGRFSPNKEKMSPDDVANELGGLSMTNKYKRTCYEKKAPPVSMSKLLSHGYVEDKKKSPNDDDASSVTSDQTSTIGTEDIGDDLE